MCRIRFVDLWGVTVDVQDTVCGLVGSTVNVQDTVCGVVRSHR